MNRFLLYLMLILGECLIIAGFFLFLQDVQPTNLFALNLVAAMCVFALGYARIFDIGQTAEMRSGYAGMGLRWFAVMLFSVASVVLIVCSIVWSLSFAFCIWLQLVFLFGVGFLLVGAKISGDNATRVLARIEDERGDLKALAAQLTLMEIAAGKSPICAEGKAAVAGHIGNVEQAERDKHAKHHNAPEDALRNGALQCNEHASYLLG